MDKFKHKTFIKMALHTSLFYYNVFLEEETTTNELNDEHQRIYDALVKSTNKNIPNRKEALFIMLVNEKVTEEIKENVNDLSFLIFASELTKKLVTNYPHKNLLPSIPKKIPLNISATFYKQLSVMRQEDKDMHREKLDTIVHSRKCVEIWYNIMIKAFEEVNLSDDLDVNKCFSRFRKNVITHDKQPVTV